MVTKISAFLTSDNETFLNRDDAMLHESTLMFKRYCDGDYSPLFGKDGRRLESDVIMAWLNENPDVIEAYFKSDADHIQNEMKKLDEM